MEKPKVRFHYMHFTGSLIVVLGFTKHYKTKEDLVIYSSFFDGECYVIPLNEFFTPHPTKGVPRYQLVTQSNNIMIKK